MIVVEGTGLDRLTIDVERATRWSATAEPFAVGVRVDSRQRVLVRVEATPGQRIDVPASNILNLPLELPPDTVLLVPPVATALRAWDLLRPELGTAAAVTPGPWAPLLSVVARWYGATPMLVGQSSPSEGRGADADSVASLAKTLADSPAVCAAELTGRADMVDLLLESLPKYSRVLFAGPCGDRFTIDYYVNVHRKGLQLSSTVLSALDVFSHSEGRDLVLRASRLLANPARAASCQYAASERVA
jgi:threonine dehydrogenase-like Zn-dependent dehydrogenase